MRTRKILFEVGISNNFVSDGLWSVPENEDDFEVTRIPIDFEWDEKEDVIKVATKALREYVNSVYKDKKFLIYYWWWRDLPDWDNDIMLKGGL